MYLIHSTVHGIADIWLLARDRHPEYPVFLPEDLPPLRVGFTTTGNFSPQPRVSARQGIRGWRIREMAARPIISCALFSRPACTRPHSTWRPGSLPPLALMTGRGYLAGHLSATSPLLHIRLNGKAALAPAVPDSRNDGIRATLHVPGPRPALEASMCLHWGGQGSGRRGSFGYRVQFCSATVEQHPVRDPHFQGRGLESWLDPQSAPHPREGDADREPGT